jgi:hypothetical protein
MPGPPVYWRQQLLRQGDGCLDFHTIITPPRDSKSKPQILSIPVKKRNEGCAGGVERDNCAIGGFFFQQLGKR